MLNKYSPIGFTLTPTAETDSTSKKVRNIPLSYSGKSKQEITSVNPNNYL